MKTVNITDQLSKHDKVTGGYSIEHTILGLRQILDELEIKYGKQAIINIEINANGEYPEVDCNLRYHEAYE